MLIIAGIVILVVLALHIEDVIKSNIKKKVGLK